MAFLKYRSVLARCELGGHEAEYVKVVVYEFAREGLTSRYVAKSCRDCDVEFRANLGGLEDRLRKISEEKMESVD